MSAFREVIEVVGTVVEVTGVAIMVIGATIATVRFLLSARSGATVRAYRLCRQDVGRAILLGLEFLVAGDIIDTVVVDPSLDSVIVLGLIILIRTFLSFTLHLEVEHRWPWQHPDEETLHHPPEAKAEV
jgi:uncharacterized membrane protein